MKRIQIVITDDEAGESPIFDAGIPEAFLRRLIVPQAAPSGDRLDERIGNILLSLGVPPHITGFQYLRQAIILAMENPGCICAVTKELYPAVAAQLGTSASRVERNIRHAIDVAWRRGHVEDVNYLLHCRLVSQSDKPTNGELIALIADRLSRACAPSPQGV